VLCLWHIGIRASRFLESIHGRWIVLFGIHMSASALHFCWRLFFGNFLVELRGLGIPSRLGSVKVGIISSRIPFQMWDSGHVKYNFGKVPPTLNLL
jgi:hypothetical protein